jgi:hypothetical protein
MHLRNALTLGDDTQHKSLSINIGVCLVLFECDHGIRWDAL